MSFSMRWTTIILPAAMALLAAAYPVPAAGQNAVAASGDASGSRKVLTIERIFGSPAVTGTSPSGVRWRGDSRAVSYLTTTGEGDESETRLMLAEVPSGKRRTLCIVDTMTVPEDLRKKEDETFRLGAYRWAETGDFIVFSYRGDVFTMSGKDAAVTRRTESDVSESNVTISPDGRRLAFTRDHDIYSLDLASNEETRLTDTGSDSLLNGVLDWVYMEELFTRGNVQAYWWSPDSRSIAYLQIDESPVREFPIVDFVPVYNEAEMQHYPKAGSDNPIVRIAVYSFDDMTTRWMDIDTTDDSYIARLYWLGDSQHLAIEHLNRNQDELRLLFADASSGDVREVVVDTKSTWINVTYNKHYYETKDRFIWNAERDGNSHLYLYKNDGTMLRQLTKGPWEVATLNGVDERKGHVYFTALEKSILERHLYRVPEKGGKIRRLSTRPGTHSVTFSPDMRFYIDRFSDVSTPTVTSVHDAGGKQLFILHQRDTSELTAYGLPMPEFFTFTSADGHEFQCSMITPNNFDPRKTYPVLIYTYGGPHAQVVRNRWGGSRYLWHAYMAERGYIIFSLDNRGSYGKGTAWEDPILRRMGEFELEDQLAGVEYLKSLPYVDPSRIGIWGWSYGGYMTSLAMFKAPGVFSAGASVAPVTDWRFYDTVYTERYMKHPDDNEDGYHDSSPVNFVEGLQAPFLLVHGTADDNVHMQNSMRLVHELINAGKDFELMLYPRKLHGISGETSRVHLFRRLTRFFDENLLSPVPTPQRAG